jgi:hypothetical protein
MDSATTMVEIALASLPHVQATLNYVAATGEKLVSYAYEPPAGVPMSNVQVEGHATTIHDFRPASSKFALDEVGFKLLTHRSAVRDFWDEDEMKRVYYPESIDLLKQVTGATEVRVFDHTLRRRVPGKTDRSAGLPRQPANLVHVDQTATSGAERLRVAYPDEAEALLSRRVAIVNLWRPITSPVLDAPLAMCDARSVTPKDLVASELVYRDRLGETYNLVYNPGQRWFYAPEMRADEVLLIKCFDSRDDGAVSRFAPHTAFTDPTAPQDAPPRESIELRTFLIFGEDDKTRH